MIRIFMQKILSCVSGRSPALIVMISLVNESGIVSFTHSLSGLLPIQREVENFS